MNSLSWRAEGVFSTSDESVRWVATVDSVSDEEVIIGSFVNSPSVTNVETVRLDSVYAVLHVIIFKVLDSLFKGISSGCQVV